MATHRIGYSRVSTADQNPASQQDALIKAGCAKVYVDHYTGTKASRPQWDRCKDALQPGNVLVVTRLDRLGRSTKDLLDIAEWLKSEDIALHVTEQNIDTTTAEGRLFFTMMAAFAEFEHSLMKARTMDGLAAARARGRMGGRKPKVTPARAQKIRERYAAKEPVRSIATDYGLSRQTIYRVINAEEQAA